MSSGFLIYGEILYDRFPDGRAVLGGAPFNVAWHLQAFGQAPLFVSRVGNDQLGLRIRDAMLTWGMRADGLQMDSAHPTGTVDVTLHAGQPSYAIVEERAYDYIDYAALPAIADGTLLYHGSLALRSAVSRDTLLRLKQARDLPCFVDINLRPPWWDRDAIQQLLAGARWLKLNDDELAELVPEADGLDARVAALRGSLALERLILTRGAAGALAIEADGSRVDVAPDTRTEVVDTVGAGDAFSSVLLLGQALDWPVRTTLERAQNFASAIVGQRGATVDRREFYQPFIDAWGLT